MSRFTFVLLALLATAAPLYAGSTFSFVTTVSPLATLEFVEGSGSVPMTVGRTGNGNSLTTTETVNYEWVLYDNGTAGSGSLTFGPSETSKSFAMTIPDDNVYTGGFFGYVSISVPGYGNVDYRDVAVLDNEPAPVLTAAPLRVPQGISGSADVLMHFTLSGPIAHDMSPYPYLVTGSAQLYKDFRFSTNVPIVHAGQTSFDVPLTIFGSATPQPDKTADIGIQLSIGASVVRGTGELTILNDKYILSPPSQQIALGSTGAIEFDTSVAAASTDHIELFSDSPATASVPASVDVPAGTLSVSVPVTANSAGAAIITAKLPASRGGALLSTNVNVVIAATFAFDPPSITIGYGSQATVHARLTPPPDAPLTLTLKNGNPRAVDVPANFTIGTDGTGSFVVRGIGTGFAFVSTSLPSDYGTLDGTVGVQVTEATGLTITSVSPKSGPAYGEQQVTIAGNDVRGRCSVMFGGVPAMNTSVANAGSLTTTTPPHAPGVVDVAIRCGTETFTLAGGYTYTAAPAKLTSIAPTTGSTSGGTIVTLTGENLTRGRCTVRFGDTPATTLTNAKTTEMTVIAPPHAAGAADVALRCGTDSSTLPSAFVYGGSEPAATIASVTPSSAAPGDRVTISGAHFRVTDTITFAGTPAIAVTTTATEHALTVPDVAAGAITIALRDNDGHVLTAPFTIRAPLPPLLLSAPASAAVGSEIVATGSDFRPSLVFTIGGTVLQSIAITSSSAILRLPLTIAPQQSTLAIRDASGATLSSLPITVTANGIAITSVAPQCMSTDGAALVTIRGSGFQDGAVVTFGLADATDVTVRDATTIVARAPSSSGATDATIVVTNPSLDRAQFTGFQYRWPESNCGAIRHHAAGH